MAADRIGNLVESRIEPLSFMLLNGLVELAFEAHGELEFEHRNEPYNPDWETYQKMESDNMLRFFALREKGNLIGYASIILDTDIHRRGVLFGSFRDIFITEKKRGYAPFFVKHIEGVLSNLGVKRVYAADRLNSGNSAWKFYQALGYEPQECLWGKTLH